MAMNRTVGPEEQLEIQRLRHQVDDLNAALNAIRKGDVDALIQVDSGELQLYSRTSADRPYRVIVEEMGEGAATFSPAGRILFANQRLAELLQCEHRSLLDTALAELMMRESLSKLDALLSVTPGNVRRATLELKRADGEGVPVLASVSLIEIEGEPVRCLIAADLTRIREAEQAVRDSELSYRMLALNSFDGILILDWESGRITRVNPQVCLLLGRNSTDLIGRRLWEINAFGDGQRAQALFLELKVNGAVRDDDLVLLDSLAAQKEVELIGNVYLVGEKKVMQINIRDISDRREVERLAQQRQADGRRSLQEMIAALVSLSEAREACSAGHQGRVANLAAAIGTELGLDAHEVEGLRISGLVHDIGMLSIPSDLLGKPSLLTPEEFALVCTHVQHGHDVLAPIEFPWPVAEAVLHHHERLDGSGYPRGLRNGEICLGGRILAVADTVEAMATARPHRAAARIEDALATIKAGRGSLFDPAVVDACLRLFDEQDYALIPDGDARQA